MESLQNSIYVNAISVRELCCSLENGLVLRGGSNRVALRNVAAKNSGSRIRQQHHQQKRSKEKLDAKCRTVSTVSDKNSVCTGRKWRLDEEAERLRDLQLKLNVCRSLQEKCNVVDRDSRVQAVFLMQKGNSAMGKLTEYELYLLKCVVAIGQAHLLGLETQEAAVTASMVNGLKVVNGAVKQQNVLKGTFQFMTQLIESLETAEALQWPSSGAAFDLANALRQKKRPFEELHGELQSLKRFVRVLDSLEKFYDCIGGIVGYQLAGIELIRASETGEVRQQHQTQETFYHVPEGKDLSKDIAFATQAAGWGVARLSELGEIYPLGGAGDRLGLVDDLTGESVPVAMLPYCGRTLLEGLIRDLQAREFLHYKIYGTQVITPVAIMTSAAKQNHKRVQDLLESHGWFGRGKDNFRLFEQPLVPTIAAENAEWVAKGALDLVLKPGGHGVIWKLAKDCGLFNWFYKKGRRAAVVRQISNPVAATDVTLLALAGAGLHQNKKFGFASCDRNVGAAEGVNVLMESRTTDGRWRYGTTCIEYTEFSRLGIADVPVSTGSLQARFPANTNVLFVDLESVEEVVSSSGTASLPGMIMNLKKPITYTDCYGEDHSIRAGRIECTMQNIADSLQNHYQHRLATPDHECLDTYILYNQRRKVTSSAKRRRKLGDVSLHQTPDGSFLDITRSAFDLLSSCGVEMPEMESSNHCYIETGPPFIALLHPAIGPLWDIIRQKICGGSISQGSEVQLEVAELVWKNVNVNGSLLVEAENIMGTRTDKFLHYGDGCGRCRLEGVRVDNKGIDWNSSSNVYWQNKLNRHESLRIILRGRSEFDAVDVVFTGSYVFEVPDGHKMTIRGCGKGFSCKIEPLLSPSWTWDYSMENSGKVHLQMAD